jgi:hypothetical protein
MPRVPGLILGLALTVAGLFLSWIWFSAHYEITATDLIARVGPFRKRIPLEAIVEVVPTRALYSPDFNLSLSLDRLRVKYRKKNGNMARMPLAISPADKEAFLHELSQLVPRLQVPSCRKG